MLVVCENSEETRMVGLTKKTQLATVVAGVLETEQVSTVSEALTKASREEKLFRQMIVFFLLPFLVHSFVVHGMFSNEIC
jgi:hypothetical protein